MHARRKLLVLAVLGATQAFPFFAYAQRQGKVWRLGYLGVQSRQASPYLHGAFMESMRDLGYVEGKNLIVEWRFADSNYERLPALATKLVNLKVDVILASSTPAITAAKRATTSIPIVMGATGIRWAQDS